MLITRRDFLKRSGTAITLTGLLGITKIPAAIAGKEKEFEIVTADYAPYSLYFSDQRPKVSIVAVNEKWSSEKGVEYAVTKAIDLIGGMGEATKGAQSILLKPNLVGPNVSDTTKPLVVESIAKLMRSAGKDVKIGEASAASAHNMDTTIEGGVCRTKTHETLVALQDAVYAQLGYADLSKRTGIPLANLHVDKMVKLAIPDNFVYKMIHIPDALHGADMVCSVPMMKTHGLATVTLSLKNIGIGGYSGLVYGTVRSKVHSVGTEVEPTGTSSVTIDMVKANKVGLTVVDATTAMEGQGPSMGQGARLVKMNLIIASTNALAADMVAASTMGFDTSEIDTFRWAWKAGMKPASMGDIEIVGEEIADVRRGFLKPNVVPYTDIQEYWGPPCKAV